MACWAALSRSSPAWLIRFSFTCQNPSQVLLFHLQNHYSLVYAARENQADEGYGGKRTIRQILVAKPGQQPCRWIDFQSVRETISSWVGHAIIGVELEHIALADQGILVL